MKAELKLGVFATGNRVGGVVVVVERQADLLEVVLAAHPGGGLADLLDGGQQAGRSGSR